jgi:hypothetical protein
MIDRLNPVGQFFVKIFQAVRLVIGQLQSAFKTLLERVKTASEARINRKYRNSLRSL